MRQRHRAFTLIEILMALMILSIGLASVLSVFVVGLHASREVVDESAAAVSAKAVLSRLLAEDALPAGTPDGVRDFPEAIAIARGDGATPLADWIWMTRDPVTIASAPPIERLSGSVGGTPPDDGTLHGAVPPSPVATGSPYSWRCRASRHRGEPGNPVKDLEVAGQWMELKAGRIDQSDAQQWNNPDNDELWRVTIEIYRDYELGRRPLATFDTYICTAHR